MSDLQELPKVDFEFPEKLGTLFISKRYKVLYGGRGGAKSHGCARAAILKGAESPLRIMCAREVQKSIKDSVHKLISDLIQELGLGAFYTILNNEIRGANGTEIIFTGLSNMTAQSIKSYEGIDICWVEEAQNVSRKSWDILIPTIRKPDSEIWITMNPELDTDETYTRFVLNPPEDSIVVKINWDDNPWFPEVLDKERKEFLRQVSIGARTQDDYDNIWEGKCKSAVDGAIYYNEVTDAKLSGRLCNVPYDPKLKVHTVWDLGWRDQMVVLFVQRLGSEVRIIDYIEDTRRDVADFVQSQHGRDDILSRKYNWGRDFIPHDGASRSALSHVSAFDILKSLGRDPVVVDEIGVEQGINAARMMFKRVVFDKSKALPLFNHLGRYKRKMNSQTNLPGDPLHDEASHAADAFRYLAVAEGQLQNEQVTITNPYAGFHKRTLNL